MSLNTTFCLKTSVLFKYFECTSNTKTTSFRSKEKNRAFFINVELTKQWVLFWVPLLVLGSVENGNSLRLEAPGPGCHGSSLPPNQGCGSGGVCNRLLRARLARWCPSALWETRSYSSAVSRILMSSGCSCRVDHLILLIHACAGWPGGHSLAKLKCLKHRLLA